MKKVFLFALFFSSIHSIHAQNKNDEISRPQLKPIKRPSLKNMVYLNGGEFAMGSDSLEIIKLCAQLDLPFDYLQPETPRHKVILSPYYIDKFEVTNNEFREFILNNPAWSKRNIPKSLHNGQYLKTWNEDNYPVSEGDYPVVNVSWYAAVAFANWSGKRLPTEAEWEFAARGGLNGTTYPWVGEIDTTKANYSHGKRNHLVKVGSYSANSFGIFDMAGNVWEYCVDEWDDEFYSKSSVKDPISESYKEKDFADLTTRRVIRGGSFEGGPVNLRVRFRDSHPITGSGGHVGFRCVVDRSKD